MRFSSLKNYLCFGATLLQFASPTLQAQTTASDILPEDPQAQACLQRAQPRLSMSQKVQIRVIEDEAVVSESTARLYWKRFDDGLSRALIRFTQPAHRSGVALLVFESEDRRREQEMVMYLPELRTTRRIVGKALAGSMFGTGFSYEDFAHMQGLLNERDLRRLANADLNERQNYVVEMRPNNPDSSYQRIVTYIDQSWCVPVASYFYDSEDGLAKELTVDVEQVREIAERWIPHHLYLHDHRGGAHTEITVLEAQVDPKLRDLMFTASGLERAR